MHISDGALSAPVLWSGAALAAAGIAVGLKKMDYSQLPKVALMSAVFFVASVAIKVPVGPSSAHLLTVGLVGLLLGWVSFPAIFVALALQAVLVGFGGLTVLGVNTVVMALPAVVVYYLFSPLLEENGAKPSVVQTVLLIVCALPVYLLYLWKRGDNGSRLMAGVVGFAAGALGVILAGVMNAAVLVLSEESFISAAQAILLVHLPIMLIEGLITSMTVVFLRMVMPEMLSAKRV